MEPDQFGTNEKVALEQFIAENQADCDEFDSCISMNIDNKCSQCMNFEEQHGKKKRSKKMSCHRLWEDKNKLARLSWKREAYLETWLELHKLSLAKDPSERGLIDIEENIENGRRTMNRRKRGKEAKTPNVSFIYVRCAH